MVMGLSGIACQTPMEWIPDVWNETKIRKSGSPKGNMMNHMITGNTVLWEEQVSSQRSNKVLSHIPRPMDFAISLVNSNINLPHRQVKFLGEFKLQKNCNQSCSSKIYWGQVKMTRGLVHASYRLPSFPCTLLALNCINYLCFFTTKSTHFSSLWSSEDPQYLSKTFLF